ncbi:MAG: SPOR domain-containing protein [Gallionellaceae bacterium]|nr:MAG: SPOR domain-containing protein [Gallionellaceae bacterium]
MAKQLTADEESILKRQARRRLIGAVALTTAVVVILPMVFDGEPPSTAVNDIELRIPDKDKVGEFQSGPAVSAVSAPAVAAQVSAPVAASAAATAPMIVVPVASAPVAASAAPAPVQTGKVEHAKAEAKPKVETNHKAEVKSATHAVPQSGFVVQIGAFSNADTAKNLQAKLGKQGFHVYTEKIGHNVRVRVGSFPTRAAAEKARHKLESQGLHPNVVNLGN